MPSAATRAALRLILAVAGLWTILPLSAHEFAFTQAIAVFEGGGDYQIDMTIDADAVALGLDPATDSATVAAQMAALTPRQLEEAVSRAKEELREKVRIAFDGEPAAPAIDFPQHGTPAAREAAIPTVLGTIARFRGQRPTGAEVFRFRAAPQFKVVHLTLVGPGSSGERRYILNPGVESPPHPLEGVAPEQSSGAVLADYLVLGFEHILPKGLDHILFVLGLFLLSPRLKPLLWQISAFTLAHTVTLALSSAGVLEAPARLVETLIALSIAWVAVENILTTELKPWRPLVVFGFGLLHGLGFAGVLNELGLPPGNFLPALVGFNVGVELGQAAVVLIALAATAAFRGSADYRRRLVVPASAVIAAVGVYWAFERFFSL